MTKSSVSWNIVLVEIESPSKKLFSVNNGKLTKTSEFNRAIEQIDDWKCYVKDNLSSVRNIFKPLLGHMGENPVNFKHLLVIGRRMSECSKFFSQKMDSLCTDTVHICTYDSMLSHYDTGSATLNYNIISYRGQKFGFKYMHSYPFNLFSSLSTDEFVLDDEFVPKLKDEGFDIDSWKCGKSLALNGKCTLSTPVFTRATRKNIE